MSKIQKAAPKQAPSFLTKTKKSAPSKNKNSGPRNDGTDHLVERHQKINFKQYLQNVKEDSLAEDEFSHVKPIARQSMSKECMDLYGGAEDVRKISFGADEDGGEHCCLIDEEYWAEIRNLALDEELIIGQAGDYNQGWTVTRTINNDIVFQSEELELSGKAVYSDLIKRLA